MAAKGFAIVTEQDVADAPLAGPAAPREDSDSRLMAQTLALLLKGLSQKALTAISNGFTALSLGSVFWLAMSVVGQPSDRQLVELAGYAVFILALEFVRRRG